LLTKSTNIALGLCGEVFMDERAVAIGMLQKLYLELLDLTSQVGYADGQVVIGSIQLLLL
jgi:hypothetical protein